MRGCMFYGLAICCCLFLQPQPSLQDGSVPGISHPNSTLAFMGIEDRLYHNLFLASNYMKETRPIQDGKEITKISVGMTLFKIVDLDIKTEIFTADIILFMVWRDFRLAWNRTEYELDSIRVPWRNVWRPDLTLWNSAEQELVPPENQNAIIFPDGTLIWAPHYIAKVHCSIAKYRTRQNCIFYFGSWTYDVTKIKFGFVKNDDPVDTTFLTPDDLWDVQDKNAYIFKMSFENGTWASEVVVANLTLNRRVAMFNTGQMQATKAVTFLVPLMFLVPITSCHNVLLAATVLVCNCLSLVVNEIGLPQQNHISELPVLQAMTSMGFTIVALFVSVILQRLYQEISPTRILPSCVRKVIYSGPARCLCFLCGDINRPPYPNAQNLQNLSGAMDDEHPITEPRLSPREGDWQVLIKFLERGCFIVFMVFAVIVSTLVLDHEGLLLPYIFEGA